MKPMPGFLHSSYAVALAVILASGGFPSLAMPAALQTAPQPDLAVGYEPTPPKVVRAMLQLAEVGANDVVYDLGCGDGRIVIAAAQRGARGVGIDLDPRRIAEAKANVRRSNVGARVQVRQEDLFTADIHDATVVMLYLNPQVNLELRPKLLHELRPGTRVVSHSYDMGDWPPAKTVQVDGHTLYYWVIAAQPAVESK